MKQPINRNISEILAKEQNEAEDKAQDKKKRKRSNEKARRLRAERKEKIGK